MSCSSPRISVAENAGSMPFVHLFRHLHLHLFAAYLPKFFGLFVGHLSAPVVLNRDIDVALNLLNRSKAEAIRNKDKEYVDKINKVISRISDRKNESD